MAKKFRYTILAQRYTARFPVLTYVGTQINFWIVANILLMLITNLQSRIISQTYGTPVESRLGALMAVAAILGFVYGVILGLTGHYLDRSIFRRLSLGKIILFKTLTTVVLLVAIIALIRYVFYEPLISPGLQVSGITMNKESWETVFYLMMIYYFFMTVLINFINQINKKYGPGILVPLLLGRYRTPKEEERIFMFMDLKSSTSTAEDLGHLKYSAFIRDCFADINEVLYPYRAQVYQYVGDEIVVTWPESEGLQDHFCIGFYFACTRQFKKRTEYYLTNYGLLPAFKAGVHAGLATVVEIGEVKRDIAYHGDTLNTAARIQSVCNEYKTDFLASKILIDKVGPHPNMKTKELGMILLKGKSTPVGLISVEWIETTL